MGRGEGEGRTIGEAGGEVARDGVVELYVNYADEGLFDVGGH